VLRKREELARHLPKAGRGKPKVALLGDPAQWRRLSLPGAVNPKPLLTHLDYERAFKTPWEVACMQVATAMGLAGHRAVEEAFARGFSEYEMGLVFLAACGQRDQELPYPAIIAANRNGATLHYQHRDRRRLPKAERRSLLLDAGCSHAGYASDITRSYPATRRGEFATMVRDMDAAQQRLCRLVRPGVGFPELQLAAHREIAGLLARWDVVRMDPEDMVARRVTDHFLPHGLGHLLGLQVHDVGGDLATPGGGALPRPKRFPRLRLTRPLQPGMVVTVEPGLYFIDSLLARLKKSPAGRRVNWRRVAALHPYGGIRIEDNVLVTADGHRNLTREMASEAV
jgi:Xaa-Pro dipeptidase